MNWKSRSGKSGLIRELMAKGFSVRQAEKGVNAVFHCMTQALRRGEQVEIPGGRINAKMKNDRAQVSFSWLTNIQTGKRRRTLVRRPGRRCVIHFQPDEGLDLSPLPTSEEMEARQLAAEILGRPVDDRMMARLQEGVDRHPHRPDALLRRLHTAKAWGRVSQDVALLANILDSLYWI